MSKGIILRESAWKTIPESKLSDHLENVYKAIEKSQLKLEVQYKSEKNYPTQAEAFGVFVRELYHLYNTLLENMKDYRDWIALQVRDTYHSQANWSDSVNLEIQGSQVQVRGFIFDSMVFKFPWVDNSLTQPWSPWDWKIPFFSMDLDEVHYFFNPKNQKLIVGKVPEEGLKLYNFNVNYQNNYSQFNFNKY